MCLVWIEGYSYVHWGAKRADVRPNGLQLGFRREQLQIRWLGLRGALWCRMLPEIHHFEALDRYPNILVLHAGGKDMAVRASRNIIRDIKTNLLRLWSACPSMIVVWSDIVPRKVWRQAWSVDCVNKARVKVNK